MNVTKDEVLAMTVSEFDQLQAQLLDWSRKHPREAHFQAEFLLKMRWAATDPRESALYAFAALGMMAVNAARIRADADVSVPVANVSVPVAPVIIGQGDYAKTYTPRIPSRRIGAGEWVSLVAWFAVMAALLLAVWFLH